MSADCLLVLPPGLGSVAILVKSAPVESHLDNLQQEGRR